jgi:PAS domain-containing protein
MNSLRHWLAVSVLVVPVLGVPVLAQDVEDPAKADLARAERARQQKKREVDELIDRRLRHDLGLPAMPDPTAPRPGGPVSTVDRERLEQEWRDQEAQTSTLLERYNKARALLEQLQAESAARTQPRDDQYVVVPIPGTTPPRQRQQPVPAGAAVSAADPAQPAGETRPVAEAPRMVPKLEPPKALIQGSADHLRVAQALFKAGQRLADAADDARGLGRLEEALEYDKKAKERLERAVEELAPLLAAKEPPFTALFCLGRCRELLFRHAERHEGLALARSAKEFQKREQEVRDPFLEIARRDVTRKGQRGEIEVLGAWGMAATAAIEHFRWMNVHGNYQPKVAIDSITWSGEKNP